MHAYAPVQDLVVAPVARMWPGETVVILGGGPSLTREDVAYCRDKARVIGIKEASVSSLPSITPPAPWADALYACDDKWWRFEQGAKGFTGLRFGLIDKADPWPGVHALRNTGDEGLELDPMGLRTGCNSGYQAINLAVHFGVKRIVLLGYDMWRGGSDENWFGYHPNHVNSPYPIFLQKFQTIVAPLKAAGVEVLNCSRTTQLRVFPRVPLEEVFR